MEFFLRYLWLFIILAVIVVLILALTIVMLIRNKKKAATEPKKKVVVQDANEWVDAFGGKDNIKGVEAKGSRLVVNVTYKTLVKKDALHNLGAKSIIVGENKVTVVLDIEAEKVAKLLK